MKRFTVLAILAVFMAQLGGSFAIASSGVTALTSDVTVSCQHYNAWENSGGTGDGISVCVGTNLSNLWNVGHTQAGYCNAVYEDAHDDWNDCISSIYNYSDHRVCAYVDANYGGSRYVIAPWTAVGWLWPNTFADSISSIKWDC